MITLLVMTDGRRECIARSLPRALDMLEGPISNVVIHDDSADQAYHDWLYERFGGRGFTIVRTEERAGFGGAIRSAWSFLRQFDHRPWVFHLEDDFLVQQRVDLRAMMRVLTWHREIVQMALLRQPVNEHEIAAGGIMQMHPQDYMRGPWTPCACGAPDGWYEHRRFFTTNPSLYGRSLIHREWPDGKHSEGRFGLALFEEDPLAVSAFWGDGEEWCEHIGAVRVGTGY